MDKEKKELDIKQVFEIVKISNFCAEYTDIDPKKGLYHRMKGYNTGGKATELKPEDRKEIAEGIARFAEDLIHYSKKELKSLK